MKFLKVLILLLLVANLSQAQSPFKRMPRPAKMSAIEGVTTVNPTITAWRFLSPVLGYTTESQIVTGSGFGYNRMHFVDSTQRYYTNFSLNGMIYAGGHVTPSIDPNNIVSIGISAGFLNQLVIIGPAYNLPLTSGTKGKIIGVISLAVPLN